VPGEGGEGNGGVFEVAPGPLGDVGLGRSRDVGVGGRCCSEWRGGG